MNIPDFSVKRRITVAMFAMIVVVMGIWSLMTLGLDLLPDIELPVITVMTSYSGAGTEEVERIVTEPLERVVGTVTNLKSVSSISKENVSMLMLEFEWGTNIDVAAQDVRDALDLIMFRLPEDVNRPIVSKFDITQMPVLAISIAGLDDTLALKKLIKDNIADKLKRLDGVASVLVFGGQEREIQVWLNFLKMQELGITLDNVVNSLRAQNMNLPAGIIEEGQSEYLLRSIGEFDSLKDIDNIIVGATSYGEPIHLHDLAEVTDGQVESRHKLRTNRKEGVMLIIAKQSTANTVTVANLVNKELERIWDDLPSNLSYQIIMDQGKEILRVGQATAANALVGALLAVILIFLFLRNWRPTFAIAIAIPLSVVATFIPISAAGYTLNIMTLGGLALGVGMLVDNAVVVIENIYRHLEMGKKREDAASVGASQVGIAITASTLTTIVVFLPMALSSGIAGQISRGLALAVSFALLCSLIVALSIVPMIASILFKKQEERRKLRKNKDTDFFQNIRNKYRNILVWSLKKRGVMMAILVGIIIVTIAAAWFFVGAEFMPKPDSGMMIFNLKLPVGTRLSETDLKATVLEDIALSIPEVERVMIMVGSSELAGGGFGPEGSNQAMAMIRLYDERSRSSKEIANEIRERFPGTANVKLERREISSSSMMGGANAAIDIKIYGKDLARLKDYSIGIVQAIRSVDGVTDVRSSVERGKPEIEIRINKEKAMRLGLPVAQLAGQIRTLTLGTVASRLREKGGEETDIRVRLRKEDRINRSDIESLPINLPMGGTVPLKEVADFIEGLGPIEIEHEQQTRLVHVFSNREGRDLSDVITDVEKAIIPVVEQFSLGYSYEIAGEYEVMSESFRDLVTALLLAIILVYAIMAALFESLSQPLVIMITLPLAAIGVVWIFLITGSTLSIVSFMGVIILAGIVVNNGIVLVDHVNQLRQRENMEKHEALVQAGMDRLRPILITAITTIFGMLPMALSTGVGAEMKGPMALTVIGGLITATFLTLFYVPFFYSIADHISYETKKKMAGALHGQE